MTRRNSSADPLPHLADDEAPAAGLRRVVLACLDVARTHLCGRRRTRRERAVHQARKALKRARALLRLVEDRDSSWARPARRRLARLARRLAGPRDTAVSLGLARRFAARDDEDAASRCARALVSPLERRRRAPDFTALSHALGRERQQLARRGWPALDRAGVARGLAAAVRRLRQRRRKARDTDDPVPLHDWRKSAVVLREQLHALGPQAGAEAMRAARRLHRLARRLGDACDLAVFSSTIARIPLGTGTQPGREALTHRADRKRRRAITRARRCWRTTRRALRRTVVVIGN